jgi:hypothetical protein
MPEPAVNSGIPRNLTDLRDRPDEELGAAALPCPHRPGRGANGREADMTRSKLVLLIALVATALATLAAEAVAARAHVTPVSGGYGVTAFGDTTCAPLSGERLHCRTTGLEATYEGTLVGASTATFTQVIDCAAGRTVGHGTETFTGSADGRTGRLTWSLAFTSDFDCASFFPSNLRIVAVVTHGTGALLGSHGVLVFDDTTYRGLLR